MKRALSILLVILMLAALTPVTLRTANADTSGQCGDNLSWSYASNRLTITGTGDMWNFTDSVPWYEYRGDIKWIYLPEGLTSIGAWAFMQCSNLVWIELPDSVTTIKSMSFIGCSTMRSISLPRGLVEIEDLAFSQCSGLNNVYYLGTETMKDDLTIDWANNKSLRDATWWYLGDHCGDNLLWSYDSATHKLTITGSGEYWDLYEEMPQPWGCYRDEIEEIELPANVPLVYPGSFAGLTALESIEIPEGVTRIGLCAFQNCTSLQSVTLPHSLEEIDEYAFTGCTALTDVYYNGADPERDEIDIDWSDNEPLSNATWHYLSDKIGENLRYEYDETTHTLRIIGTGNMWGYVESRVPWFDYRSEITSVELPDGVTNIGGAIFSCLTSMKEITIPDGVTYIGMYAFTGCTALKKVTFTNSVQNIYEGAFCNCSSLTDVYFAGTEEDRAAIDIDSDENSALLNATWHYRLPGDINGDGKVNNKDVNRLLQYLAGDDVTVVLFACDVNGDGKINNKDVNRLLQYLAGDDVEIH